MRKTARLVVAGEETGCGKTTVALGIMGAAAARGMRVQGWKSGPDYIDPSWFGGVSGRAGRNLDLWMLDEAAARELFVRSGAGVDLNIVEGAMGLFDGAYPDDRGSTAHLAKALDAPVVLVLDAWRSSSSLGARALGYRSFDPDVRVAGVIINRVAGEAHEAAARRSIERAGLPVLGALPRQDDLSLPERHLGLVPLVEAEEMRPRLRRIVDTVTARLDVDALLRLAAAAAPLVAESPRLFAGSAPARPIARIAVARDPAFSFIYEDDLDLLRHAGAEIVEFSPLGDARLPEAHLVLLGGGFPEVHAASLSGNAAMRLALRDFQGAGGSVYAECGGFMYLGETLAPAGGAPQAMASVLPVRTAMTDRLQALRYVEVEVLRDAGLFRRGDRLRGHEFHFSRLEAAAGPPWLRVRDSLGHEAEEGVIAGTAAGSYIHLHLASSPAVVAALPSRLAELAASSEGRARASRAATE